MARPDTKPIDSLSAEDARRITLSAQGLDGLPAGESISATLDRLGAVQLDTISVLARSHELVIYARHGSVPRAAIEQAYWAEPARSFEYLGHAACILPLDLWPYFSFRRRVMRERERNGISAEVFAEARARLREGPALASEVGTPTARTGWWNWSEGKEALDALYRTGEAAVTVRRGWRRVYDLPERVIPTELLAAEPSDEECFTHLVKVAAHALGIGTAREIANYFHLTTRWTGTGAAARSLVATAIEAAGLAPVRVEGWPEVAFVDPEAFAAPQVESTRATLLSPFDSLIWASPQAGEGKERERIRRLFGFSYSFEAYVPRDKRVHGYFVMPLLANGRLAGRVDPRREGRTFVAASVSFEDVADLESMASALFEAAAWVGCDAVRIERVSPPELAEPLRRLVS